MGDVRAMNPVVKTKWMKALRSGRYKQTRAVLHDADGYCCLGVLCQVMGKRSVPGSGGGREYPGASINEDDDGWFDERGNRRRQPRSKGMPPQDVCEAAELDVIVVGDLANLNDEESMTFKEIADWIEVNL